MLERAPAAADLPGVEERALRGPVRRKGIGPSPSGWLDPRGRRLGGRAFALNRVTGLALVLYLYLHLGVLSVLLLGASAWDDLVAVATSSVFLALDVVLMFGLLFHGLNGIRVALIGSGVIAGRHRPLFWAATVLGAAALAYGAFSLAGGG
jgi:succinate dehydrogenase / fumarate reductase cytochrome b subunit